MFLKNRKTFFEKFKTAERPELLRRVIEWAESEDNQSNRLYIRFRQDAEALREDLEMASELLKEFPLEEPVYLPIFAATVTKDPHAFDTDKTDKGRFLIYLLQVIRHLETDVPINSSLNAEERNELLLSYNLLKDDLSNYVTIYNVEAKDVDGVESEFLKMAAKQRVALNLPLKEVLRVESFFTKQKRIFVVENSSVASKMMNHATETNSDCSIVCGNGVMNMATILFLDKFVKSGGSIVYSGDFDPEGLLIAQRLVTRYGEESVDLSAFSVELYRKSLSNLIISYERLKKLSKIDDSIPELFEIRLMMMRETRAGYQENYLKDYLSELEKPYKSGLGPDEFLDFFKRSLEFRI